MKFFTQRYDRVRRLLCVVILSVAWMVPGLSVVQAEQGNTATYEVALDISWSSKRTPYEFPNNAHLTEFIGVTHNSKYILFRDGLTSSSGLELIAENGRSRILNAELEEADRRKRIGTTVRAPALNRVPGSVKFRFSTDRKHPRISFVSMLAPSPDWFTGLADVQLFKDGQWVDNVQAKLWAWDAGTDSGQTYVGKNRDTQPSESVRLVATQHFLTQQGLQWLGIASINRVAE